MSQVSQVGKVMAAAVTVALVVSVTAVNPAATAKAEDLWNRGKSVIWKQQNGEKVSMKEWKSVEEDLTACADFSEASKNLLASCHYGRGIARTHLQKKKPSEAAVHAFNEVLRLDPDHAGALLQRGGQLLGLGHRDKGICDIRRAVELQPMPTSVLYQFASVLPSSNEKTKTLRRVLEAEPDHPGATSWLITELQWQGQSAEAGRLMERASARGIFPSKWQRPRLLTRGLRAIEFWAASDDPMVASALRAMLQATPGLIEEYANFSDWSSLHVDGEKSFQIEEHEEESLWQLHTIYNGTSLEDCHPALQKTCGLLQQLSSIDGLDLIDSDFSVLQAGAHLRPHCGPHNARLTFHVPLSVPTVPSSIRVGAKHKNYVISEPFAFDDSFEHEVWNQGPEHRAILLITVSHPDLTAKGKR